MLKLMRLIILLITVSLISYGCFIKGNPILKNDCIGIKIGKRLENDLSRQKNIHISEFVGSPLDLVIQFAGYQTVILVDSMMTGTLDIGTVVVFKEEDLLDHSKNFHSLHGINLPEALAISKSFDFPLPPRILLIGIEVGEAKEFGETLSDELNAKMEDIYQNVVHIVSGVLN